MKSLKSYLLIAVLSLSTALREIHAMMSTPRRILLILLSIVGIASPAFGQHILACKGTDQVLIGSRSLFQMEEGKVYPIIGISASGNLMLATPLGGADYHGDRLRVTDSGQYGSADITLQNVRATHSQWSGVLTNAGVLPVGQCYAAVQWYHDGRPTNASPQVIGTLNPGSPVTISVTASADSGGTYSFHLWSGENEIKPRIIEGPEW